MGRFFTTILCLVAIGGVCGPLQADRGVGSIRLTVNPAIIPADGKTICTISASVRDRDGNLVPDGTEIQFSASLGLVEEAAETSSGVARAKLTSADIPGDSVVTATWLDGQAVSQTSVTFAVSAGQFVGPQYLSIESGEYLAYSIDYRVMEAIGDVRIRYRMLEITADSAQVDLQMDRIVARGEGREKPITIRAGEKTITGSLLVCGLESLQGQLISIADGTSFDVDLAAGSVTPSDGLSSVPPEDQEFVDLSASSILIKARRAVIFPSDKIQFKRVSVYVNRKHAISFPYYVLSLTDYQADEEQYVGYGTGGLTLNLPVYYSLTPTSSGALLLRRGESAGWGWYGQSPGWYLDVRQRYSSSNASGQILLSQVTNQDWGAHFNHNQQFDDRTQGYLYLDWAAHEDLYGMVNLNRSYDRFNAGLNVYGSHSGDGADYHTTEMSVRTRPRPVGSIPARLTFLSRTAYSSGSGLVGHAGLQQSVLANIQSSAIRLGSSATFRSTLGMGYLWGSDRASGLSSVATAMLDWRLATYSRLQVNYRFADRATSYTSSVLGKQSLSANLRVSDGKRWGATLYAMRGLDYASSNFFGDLSYRVSREWRVGVRSTSNRYGDLHYNDTEYALGKLFGSRELIAVWSQSQQRVMLELGYGGF